MGKILKGGKPNESAARPSTPKGRLPAKEFEARQVAQEILESARRDAQALRDAQAAEVERARSAGFAAGRDEGLGQVTEEIARARAQRERALVALEREVIAVALGAAEKIIGREVRDAGAAADIVAQALDAVRRARFVRVRVATGDLELLRQREEALVARLSQGATFELCADDKVGRGGCIVETESGVVDARLETQIAALRRALLGDE